MLRNADGTPQSHVPVDVPTVEPNSARITLLDWYEPEEREHCAWPCAGVDPLGLAKAIAEENHRDCCADGPYFALIWEPRGESWFAEGVGESYYVISPATLYTEVPYVG